MSGYSSKKEAQDVVRRTIPLVAAKVGLPTRPGDYFVGHIYKNLIHNRGVGYGWAIDPDPNHFIDALENNRRK